MAKPQQAICHLLGARVNNLQIILSTQMRPLQSSIHPLKSPFFRLSEFCERSQNCLLDRAATTPSDFFGRAGMLHHALHSLIWRDKVAARIRRVGHLHRLLPLLHGHLVAKHPLIGGCQLPCKILLSRRELQAVGRRGSRLSWRSGGGWLRRSTLSSRLCLQRTHTSTGSDKSPVEYYLFHDPLLVKIFFHHRGQEYFCLETPPLFKLGWSAIKSLHLRSCSHHQQ